MVETLKRLCQSTVSGSTVVQMTEQENKTFPGSVSFMETLF